MNQYKKYMDRQGVSPSLHARLTALAEGGEYWLPAVCWQQDWPGPAASGSRMGPPRLTAWTVPGCSPPRAGPRTRGAPRPWRRMKSSSRPLCGR